MSESYETHARGIRIVPGLWRPHYRFEQIAWVSPPWPSQDYVWLDFPEAIFTDVGLLYLSHVNPAFPVVFPDLPKVPWQTLDDGIRVDRTLPDGVAFGGSVRRGGDTSVALELYLRNGSDHPLRGITLQTCAFLRGIKEFGDYTQGNKFVHVPPDGWCTFETARGYGGEDGRYCLGWRGGPKAADWPVMVTQSNAAERLVAMTWFDSTRSLVGNPNHPCMHADPGFPDLEPGAEARIHGALMFFEGSLDEFSLDGSG